MWQKSGTTFGSGTVPCPSAACMVKNDSRRLRLGSTSRILKLRQKGHEQS